MPNRKKKRKSSWLRRSKLPDKDRLNKRKSSKKICGFKNSCRKRSRIVLKKSRNSKNCSKSSKSINCCFNRNKIVRWLKLLEFRLSENRKNLRRYNWPSYTQLQKKTEKITTPC